MTKQAFPVRFFVVLVVVLAMALGYGLVAGDLFISVMSFILATMVGAGRMLWEKQMSEASYQYVWPFSRAWNVGLSIVLVFGAIGLVCFITIAHYVH